MEKNKLTSMISILSQVFAENHIPVCLIGAFALGFFGLPRHTVDIDFMADSIHWNRILEIMARSGYVCFQKTRSFAQFDSDYDIFGKVDVMLVDTEEGRAMLNRSVWIDAELIGKIRVIQPSDYIVLKLLAIANNKERRLKDESDIAEFFKTVSEFGLSDRFEGLDFRRIRFFAEKFGQDGLIKKYIG